MNLSKRIIATSVLAAMTLSITSITSAENYTYNTWDGTVTTDWLTTYTGAEDDPYIIDSSADLAGLAQLSLDNTYNGFKNKHFEITTNLDLNNISWTPINSGNNVNSETSYTSYDTNGGYLLNSSNAGKILYDLKYNTEYMKENYAACINLLKNEGIEYSDTQKDISIENLLLESATGRHFLPVILTSDNKVYISAYRKTENGEIYANGFNMSSPSYTSKKVNGVRVYTYTASLRIMTTNVNSATGVANTPYVKEFTWKKSGGTITSSDFGNQYITLNDNGSWDYFDDVTFLSATDDTSTNYWISLDGLETYTPTNEDRIVWCDVQYSTNTGEILLTDVVNRQIIGTDYINAYFKHRLVNGDNTEIIEFNGHINGNNFRIKNLNSDTGYIHGLFGVVGSDATIENIVIENASISGSESSPATALCFVNNGNIDNVHILSTKFANAEATTMGGIAGINYGTIKNSSFAYNTDSCSAGVKNKSPFGGIAGYNTTTGIIENCESTINTSIVCDTIGGIAGINEGNIKNCKNAGTHFIPGERNRLSGGITGVNGLDGTIENCVNNADLGEFINSIIPNSIGGIAGSNYNVINNCVNNNVITGYDASGIVANNYSGNVTNCINFGDMYSHYNAAGIVGEIASGLVSNCHNFGILTAANSNSGSAGGIVDRVSLITNQNAMFADSITVENCDNYGNVYGIYDTAGVITGETSPSSVVNKIYKNCNNYGNISSTSPYLFGGFAGMAINATIENCNNYGNVKIVPYLDGSSASTSGGFATFISRIINSTLKNCMSIGDFEFVDKRYFSYVGGFAHTTQNSTFFRCGTIDTTLSTPIINSSSTALTKYSTADNYDSCFAILAFEDINGSECLFGGIAHSFANTSTIKNCYIYTNKKYDSSASSTYNSGFLGGVNSSMHPEGAITNCYYLYSEGLTDFGMSDSNDSYDSDNINTFKEIECISGSLAYNLDKGGNTDRTTNWTVVEQHDAEISKTVGDFTFNKTITIPAHTGFATETYKPVYKQTIGNVSGSEGGKLTIQGLANIIADEAGESVYLRAGETVNYTHNITPPYAIYNFTYN